MLRIEAVWREFVCLFYKLLLPFLTFGKCEGSYLVEGFLYNLCSCFDIVFFANRSHHKKFVAIVPASERYIIINSGRKDEAVLNMPCRNIS